MELCDLRTIVREDRLADVYDNPSPDADSQRWTNAFIDRYLNEGQRAACRGTDLLFDSTTSAIAQISLVAGTSSYSISSKITRIMSMTLDDEPLRHVNEREMLGIGGDKWRTETGTPEMFLLRSRTLTVFPKPIVSGTAYLEVYRLPLCAMEYDTDEPEIPEEHHEALCFYAEYRGYLRKDEDTYNPEKASHRLASFEAHFGQPDSAELRAHRLEQPRNTRFGLKPTCRSTAWPP